MDTRIIPCSACGGDRGHHDFAGHWVRCVVCNGSGEEEIELDGADPHEECGRWDNGRLVHFCAKAGTEDCVFCPYARDTAVATNGD